MGQILSTVRAFVSDPTSRPDRDAKLPVISPFMLKWFTWYSRRYIQRHFHGLRISLDVAPPEAKGRPLVIYSNHASWWDPLTCLVLKQEFFSNRAAYSPIDSRMLERYKIFKKLGFFGVEQGTARGALRFIRVADRIFSSPQNILALTPQGKFTDVRERPVRFKNGLGHLASRFPSAIFVPLAIEYTFWDERLPEILTRFGEPVHPENYTGSPDDWTTLMEAHLEQAQDKLAIESKNRDQTSFRTLLRGGAGQGGIYDLWRSMQSWARGRPFQKEHQTYEL